MSIIGRCNIGFHRRPDGVLFCDDVRIPDLHRELISSRDVIPTSPVYVYSRRQLQKNVQEFKDAFKTLPVPAILNFSVKANHNLQILKLLQSLSVGVTLVSGLEQRLAQEAGFEPQRMLLNGTGKTAWELQAAIRNNVLLNVDSEFDLHTIIDVCRQEGMSAQVLLRLNLDIDPKVPHFISTGTEGSKFGLDPTALTRVTKTLTSDLCPVLVKGLHSHLGSTIKDVDIIKESLRRLLALRSELQSLGLKDVNLINIGGGLNIDYTRHKDGTQPFSEDEDSVQKELLQLRNYLQHPCHNEPHQSAERLTRAIDVIENYVKERIPRSQMDSDLQDALQQLGLVERMKDQFPALWKTKLPIPSPADLTRGLSDAFLFPRDDDVTLMFEPGRAIVGNAGVLLATALGVKTTGPKKFLVVDAAMTEVIRPCLYGAYHHIDIPTSDNVHLVNQNGSCGDSSQDGSPMAGPGHIGVVDVVGPVCESSDFLGKNRLLKLPAPGACVVVHDVGAYCSSMASNYNMRPRAAEVMVDGSHWSFIRRADTLEDILAPYKLDHTTPA